MSHQSRISSVKNGIVLLQTFGHVVGIEDGHVCGFGQSVTTHQGNIHPGNREDARTAERSSRGGTNGLRPAKLDHGMPRKKRHEMPCHPDRSHAGSSPAMGNTKRLVEVEMTD